MMGRRRLKKKYRRALHLILAGLVLLIALICLARHCEQREPEPSRYYPSIRNLKAQFNDLNPLHLEAGRSLGLAEPPESREDINTWRLREIKDCRYYVVDRLDYSVPYLTRGGARLLDEIGVNFRDSLEAKGMIPVRFKLSSVLRTKDDVRRLRRSGNVNASENSSHCYGCTFDIAWASYDLPKRYNATWDQYRGVMAEVLRDLRAEGKCYVKFEAKESCFHITSRL
ncbi:MAG: DUF5715 family protein [Candidatus Cryptobacteroides sp.]|nr:DUF5715 family protein [Bacteroidales bacterium]MDY5743199.1 DUF5715 family protein [Candidatus Cryptobacteroides sp.]